MTSSQHQLFYHANCVDGFHAANKFINNFKESLIYTPIGYGDMDELVKGSIIETGVHTLWFVDFTPEVNTLIKLMDKGFHVIVIDHHMTAIEAIHQLSCDEDTCHLIKDGKLIYILSEVGFSGSSLVAALDGYINRIDEYPLQEHRIIRAYAGDNVECTVHTNLSYLELDRLVLMDVDLLIETYDLWITNSPLFERAQYLHTYLQHINILKTDPRIGVQHRIAIINAAKQSIYADRNHINYAIMQGEAMFKAKYDIARTLYHDMRQFPIPLENGKHIFVSIGNIPDRFGTMLGFVSADLSELDHWVTIGIQHDYRRNRTVLELRSDPGTKVRAVAEALGGGGHDCAGGVTYKTMRTNQDDLLCDIIDALINLEGLSKDITHA